MISWIILIGIIVIFILCTYYLYQSWKFLSKNKNFFNMRLFKSPDKIPKIDRKAYESAYRSNTNFSNSSLDNQPVIDVKKVHHIYAFHQIETPDYQGIDQHKGKEGWPEEKEEKKEEYGQEQVQIISEDFPEVIINSPVVVEQQVVVKQQEDNLREDELQEEQVQITNEGGLTMPELQQVGGLELIKTPVVIGENVIQRMEVSDLPLDMAAIKIKEITTNIRDLVTDVIQDKVLIQGTLHKQIFYVGIDNIIHHQMENISFSHFIDIPGAEPGMDVLIEPEVEHVFSKLILDGSVLHQKVVVQFFVKVLSVQQLIVETGIGPLVKAQRVIGENTVQTMINNEVTLAVEAIKIVDITAKVVGLETEIIEDKVIMQGIVHKQLFYIGTDDVEHHQAEDIPFSEFVDIPGAEPGMNVQVYPNIEHIKQVLSPDGTMVAQEIVLELFVKVTESVQINLVTGNDSLVMLPEVVGENVKQILSETMATLTPTAIKVKNINAGFEGLNAVVINDKVIIQGIIHKQIFFIGEDNIEYHQAENVPFSTFIDVIGARPGMDVQIIPSIAFIKPILSNDGVSLTQKVIADIFVKVTENIQFNVNEVGPYGV